MTLADSYAKALHELVGKNPAKQGEYLKGLIAALKRRGHEKLLPRILKAYELQDVRHARAAAHAQVTPEKERNRVLLELYRRLVTSQ